MLNGIWISLWINPRVFVFLERKWSGEHTCLCHRQYLKTSGLLKIKIWMKIRTPHTLQHPSRVFQFELLRTLGPVKKLPWVSPRNHTINSPTAIFSPPLSALTQEGYPIKMLPVENKNKRSCCPVVIVYSGTLWLWKNHQHNHGCKIANV